MTLLTGVETSDGDDTESGGACCSVAGFAIALVVGGINSIELRELFIGLCTVDSAM